MKNIVITGAARSAVGAYLGSLKTVEAQDLGAAAIRAAAQRSVMPRSISTAHSLCQVRTNCKGLSPIFIDL